MKTSTVVAESPLKNEHIKSNEKQEAYDDTTATFSPMQTPNVRIK